MHKSSRPQPHTPPSPEPAPVSPQKTPAKIEPTSSVSTAIASTGPKTPPEPEEKPGDLDNASQSSYHPEDGEISSSPDENAAYIRNIRTPPEPEPVPESPKPVIDEKEQEIKEAAPLVETQPTKQEEEEEPVKSDEPEKIENFENDEETPKTDEVTEQVSDEVSDEVADEVVEPPAPVSNASPEQADIEEEKSEPIESQKPFDTQCDITQAVTIPKIDDDEQKPTPVAPAENFLLDSIIDSVILKSQTSENPPLTSLNQNLNVESNVKESTLASVGSQSPSSTKAKSKQTWMHLNQMDTNENTNEQKGDENRAATDLITSN